MPKEKLCDCGKPISQCQCKGHNHNQTKNVKKAKTSDELSDFGDMVQEYANAQYKRQKRTERPWGDNYGKPFGMVIDIGDYPPIIGGKRYMQLGGGLKSKKSYYNPGRSRGTSMTKKAKVQMCEECGKPEFACKCKGHQGKHSMSKSMCKCGSGMSKAMCKCGGMGKKIRKESSTPDYINYLQNAKSKGMMGRVSTDEGPQGTPGTRGSDIAWAYPHTGAGTHRQSYVRFNSQGTRGIKKGDYIAPPFSSREENPEGRKKKSMPKFFGGLPPKENYSSRIGPMASMPMTMSRKPRNDTPYEGRVSSASDYIDYLHGKRDNRLDMVANMPRKNVGKNMKKRRMPFPPPPPSPFGDGIKGTIMTFSGKMPGKMKDMFGLGNIHDVFKDSPMKLFSRMGKREKQRPEGYGHSAERGHNPAENAVRQSVPTSYDTARYRLQVFDDKKKKQIESLFKMPLSEIPKKYLEMLSEAIKEVPEQHKVMFDMMGGALKRPREITAKNPLEQLKEHYGMDKHSSKKGKKVNKAWPFSDSEFEENGGDVSPQRRKGFLTTPEFGYRPMRGYNPAENAVRQMTATPEDVARADRSAKMDALGDAALELLGSQARFFRDTRMNPGWWERTIDRADRAANNTADTVSRVYNAIYPPEKGPTQRGTLKRLSKSMKMDADMAKQPQKITPKRTIRHTDKYFK